MQKNNKKELIELIASTLRIKKKDISINSNFRNTKKWDSLSHLKLLVAIESKYNLKIDAETSFKLISIKEIFKYLSKIRK